MGYEIRESAERHNTLDENRLVNVQPDYNIAQRKVTTHGAAPKAHAVLEGLRELAAVDHELFGHAPAQHTGPPRAAGRVGRLARKGQLADGRLDACARQQDFQQLEMGAMRWGVGWEHAYMHAPCMQVHRALQLGSSSSSPTTS
jgi:hypothetical protein